MKKRDQPILGSDKIRPKFFDAGWNEELWARDMHIPKVGGFFISFTMVKKYKTYQKNTHAIYSRLVVFHQAIWRIITSQIGIISPGFGVKIKKYLKPPASIYL